MSEVRLRSAWPIAALFGATLPLIGGTVSLDPVATKTDFGFYSGGTVLNISVSGTVSLDGPGEVVTNPDGSLNGPLPGPYQYFAANYAAYPVAMGGDGVNHFSGGGGNWDIHASPHLNLAEWAGEGAITTDTTAASAIRFGAVAGTWSGNPAPNSPNWFLVGYGGNFTVPASGANLYLIVVDTYYANDFGSYSVSVNSSGGPTTPVPTPIRTPEPSSAWLTAGLLLVGAVSFSGRRQLVASNPR